MLNALLCSPFLFLLIFDQPSYISFLIFFLFIIPLPYLSSLQLQTYYHSMYFPFPIISYPYFLTSTLINTRYWSFLFKNILHYFIIYIISYHLLHTAVAINLLLWWSNLIVLFYTNPPLFKYMIFFIFLLYSTPVLAAAPDIATTHFTYHHSLFHFYNTRILYNLRNILYPVGSYPCYTRIVLFLYFLSIL